MLAETIWCVGCAWFELCSVFCQTSKRRPTVNCYISYSRFTARSNDSALRLFYLLEKAGVTSILDVHHRVEMADNEPYWIEKEIIAADVVLVLLDEAYPWNLTEQAAANIASLDLSGDMRRTKKESEVLQSLAYSGPKSIVPVIIGPLESRDSVVPPLLRCKTIYHLPEDFDNSSEKFIELIASLIARQVCDPEQASSPVAKAGCWIIGFIISPQ